MIPAMHVGGIRNLRVRTATKSYQQQQGSNHDSNVDDQKYLYLRRKMVKFWKEEDLFFLVNPNYSAIRRICIIIGAWPYETRKEQELRFYFTFFLLAFLLIGLITSYFAKDFTIYALVDSFLVLGPTIIVFLEYYTVTYKSDFLRTILNHIRNDWCHLKTAKELEIVHKYAKETRFYILIFTAICFLPVVAYVIAVILITVDFAMKKNGTRRYDFPFHWKYFLIISQDEHFFSFTFITLILLILLPIVYSANLGLFLMTMHHACGMFRIVGVILGSAFDKKGLTYNELDEEVTSATLIRAIVHHSRVIEFVNKMNTAFETTYLIHTICGNITFGVDIIVLLQCDSSTMKRMQIFTTIMHTLCVMIIGLCHCHVGQKLLDDSIDVFQETSIMPWYLFPPRLQKLSLLVMMRGMKQCSITFGKFFMISHKLLTKGCQFASSYAMAFHTIHSV